mmetsp:Transcript_4233/g.5576  ORF Transcript_4233/g.5576 Transcript_4233/m.5576 type:complete len:105 (-) Transcript_4233:471-785(-)|eukprot:CAMPEP_0198153796 /NCGR_PEP_ID=MMETSP1443-20131203/65803_1 /TAXON_ID=186043 /ORGANISM="Entomoneis sp., Strain CCMP2396" /LENGTH=104 /DNA_ID=CAMNT_0043820265 /DNA_START=80 /DNA_END=397 /DNA_ORIENTATION=-
MATKKSSKGFSNSLVKKLVLFNSTAAVDNVANKSNQRISNDATLAAGELLRLFVVEARNRASLLAECEQEGEAMMAATKSGKNQISIRSDHVTQVAAELLMDFS